MKPERERRKELVAPINNRLRAAETFTYMMLGAVGVVMLGSTL